MGKQEGSWKGKALGCSPGSRSKSGGRQAGGRRASERGVRLLDMGSCVEDSFDSSTICYSTEIASLRQENKILSAQMRGLVEKVNFLNKWRTKDRYPADSGTAEVKIIASDGMLCKAHRLILEGRSDVLYGMLTPGNESYLGDRPMYMNISSASVRLFLTFLYSGELSVEDLKAHSMDLLWAAQKYQIPTLRVLCEEFNIQYLGQLNLANALRGFEMASNELECKYLEESAVQSISGKQDLAKSPEFLDLKGRDLTAACRLLQELYAKNLLGRPASPEP